METSDRKEVLRMIPHGLQVVTLRDGDEVHGYTSSWMTQGSFEPPLVVAEVLDARLHREGEPLSLADTPWQYGG